MTWKPAARTRCSRCDLRYAAHAKMYNYKTRKFETAMPGACDQYQEPATLPATVVNQITAGIDWLTAWVLAKSLGRKH